MDAFVGLFGLI